MKKLLCALLALLLCLSMALAEEELYVEEPEAVVEESPAFEQPVETEVPMEEPTEAEPTQEPTAEPEPSIEPTEAPAEEPTETFEPEAYEGRIRETGQMGTLEELLSIPGAKTIYVSTRDSVRIANFNLGLLQEVELLPDPEVFGSGHIVELLFGDGQVVTLTISVVREREEEPEPLPTQTPIERVVLKVTPRNFTDGAWGNEIPSFLLEGIPMDDAGYCYAAVIYDERVVPLSGDEYLAREEGVYAVRFAILDALGDVASKSEKYVLMLDFTPPELTIDVSTEFDYTMTLSADDNLSGVEAYSLDGGQSWSSLSASQIITYTQWNAGAFAPGSIQVRDQAGNVASNAEAVTLDAIPKESSGKSGSSGGGGGGSGGSSKSVPHASGDGDAAPYDAYELTLPEGPVAVLTLGGEEIDLGLEIEGEEEALFTAGLDTWAVETPLAPEVVREDTLVLRAQTETPGACTWRINGAVLRKLYNSDILYLTLAANDAMLSLPTMGFTAGTRYAELKMEGVSNAEFEYEVVMRTDPDAGISAELRVEVAGERYEMVDRYATPEMYPYDVYCGQSDLMDYPYGAYPGGGWINED